MTIERAEEIEAVWSAGESDRYGITNGEIAEALLVIEARDMDDSDEN
jgi:hypothetical protein